MFPKLKKWRQSRKLKRQFDDAIIAKSSSVLWAINMLKHGTSRALEGLNPRGGLGTLRIAELELEDALLIIQEARIWWYEKEQPNG